jgi:hypothetical protein
MNEASRWRFQLAQQIGRAYAASPKARVVMVAGSTGRGTADRFSDVEIDVYWSDVPTDEERLAIARETGADEIELMPYEEDEWAEALWFNGFSAHTSTFLVETMERYLHEVVDEFNVADNPHIRLSSLLHAQTLVGADLAARWRAKAAVYPSGLTDAVLRANLTFDGLGYGEDMFLARDDTLVLYDIFVRVSRQLLRALLGLNRLYLPNPTFKGMAETIAEMSISPRDLTPRLTSVFQLPLADGVSELHRLCEETLDLVDRHVPRVETAPFRAKLRSRRGAWDGPHPPAGG